MKAIRCLLLLWLSVAVLSAGQVASDKTPAHDPSSPVIDYKACPFEGCTFGKWLVVRDTAILSTWKDGRKPVATLKKGDIVTGLTGVHITYEPDRIKVFKSIPELGVQPGEIILRYMYHGEGFADIWVKGHWEKNYDCTFITEKDGSGCLGDCVAQVVSEGKKDWWVKLKTAKGSIGWAKAEGQFNCMDAFGGDPECEKL
jgi:hypothetical protein